MAVVTQTITVAAQPLPPSPTLTNPDMILPDLDRDSTPSPTRLAQRPPSPSALLRQISPSPEAIKLANAPLGRRSASPRTLSSMSSLTARTSYATLPGIEEHATPRRMDRFDNAIASSPTLRTAPSTSTINTWKPEKERSISGTSSSIASEDLSPSRWAGFDGVAGADDGDDNDSPDAGDEELGNLGPLPDSVSGDEDLDQDRWLDGQDDVDSDMFESNALSRRAEMILANAKKRLSLMEGNLRGARHSILPTSQSLNSLKMASELSAQLAAARERDRRLYGGPHYITSVSRGYHSSPLTPNSPGHSRGLSETFTPGSLPAGAVKKIHLSQKRASSALGPMPGPWSPTETVQFPRSASLTMRGSRSQEQMRNERIASWQASTYEEHPLRRVSPAPNSNSSGASLEPLPENEPSPTTLKRPGSTTSDIRAQMSELKGRISSLQIRAREDSLKRRSLQSMRTPSPFTQAEIWYTGVDGYKGNSLTTDAGVGTKADGPQSPVDASHVLDLDQKAISPTQGTPEKTGPLPDSVEEEREIPQAQTAPSEYEESNYEDAEEPAEDHQQALEAGEHNEEQQEVFGDADEVLDDILNEGYNEEDFPEDVSQSEQESVYMDPEYIPAAERHEDRADAFDYEHFFLHSAMGTYSAGNRRGSVSSESSVETTRPISPRPILKDEPEVETEPQTPRPPFHQRNASATSVSTVDTFQTAAEDVDEENGADEEDEGESLDQITQQIIHHNRQSVVQTQQQQKTLAVSSSNSQLRADSAVVMPEQQRSVERDVKYSPAQQIVQLLMEAVPRSTDQPQLDQEDKDLLYALAVGFEEVCRGLQSTTSDQYERRLLRRRLDDAKRMLDGDGEGEAF